MRYIITLNGSREDAFRYALSDVDSQYFNSKGIHIYELDRPKGTTFSVPVVVGGKVSKDNRLAALKITDYQYPDHFAFDYKSTTYHKLCEYRCEEKNGKTVVYIHMYDERLANGNVTKAGKDSDTFKKAPVTVSVPFKNGFRRFVKALKEEEKKASE